jgi:AcrR family transcriptional regulator
VSLEPARRRRGRLLEEAILDAAWAQLEADGYAGFTIEAVADRAGTSRPVIYRRWGDKDELVGAAIAHGLRWQPVEVPDTGSLRADVVELLRRASDARASLLPLFSVLIGSYFASSGVTFADLRSRLIGGRTRFAIDEILDRGIARGEVDPARLTPRVRAVAFDLFRHDLMMTLKPVTDEQIAAIVDEVFLPLVRPVPGQGRA